MSADILVILMFVCGFMLGAVWMHDRDNDKKE